mgnify:FL=1
MKYTNKTIKSELLFECNRLQQQQTVLIYLLLFTFTIGVLF